MILLFGVAAAVPIALLRGGDLKNLGKIHVRWAWVALVALTIQIILTRGLLGGAGPARLFFPLTHAAIFAVAWVNRDRDGMWWLAAGAALNFIVIAANGGFMPTTAEALVQAGLVDSQQSAPLHTRITRSKDIILPKGEIALWWLADVVPIVPIHTIISVGDVLIAIGLFVFVQGAMLQREDTGW